MNIGLDYNVTDKGRGAITNLAEDAYGSEQITIDNLSDAVAMFLGAINATDTRFDRSIPGNVTAPEPLTALELQGEQLFNTKYQCNNCHQPSIGGYSSTSFMNIGLDYNVTDKGRGAITNLAEDMGRFKIPNLRNVALTAPYMHDGRFRTLDDVLEHYSHGIKNNPNLDSRLRTTSGDPMRMNISPDEKKAIIAFLNTLTDYNMITAQQFSNPFKLQN